MLPEILRTLTRRLPSQTATMGRTVFQVTLYNFRCDALSCGNAKTYLKVNFAGGYKNLQSETSEDQIYNFGMASSFNFTTCVSCSPS
jgi:hypothetical protein